MKNKLEEIRAQSLAAISAALDLSALDAVRVQYLGKKGSLSAVLKQLGGVSPEERPVLGQLANEVRARIETALSERGKALQEALLEKRLRDI